MTLRQTITNVLSKIPGSKERSQSVAKEGDDDNYCYGGSGWLEVIKSEQEWRSQLTDEQFRITRQKGTERPFSGPHQDYQHHGQYNCVCCNKPLFDSKSKYDSGTGWPSFFAPISRSAVQENTDISLGMKRAEVCCSSCASHLGHVFPDGPPPTNMRYCINGHSLKFLSDKKDDHKPT